MCDLASADDLADSWPDRSAGCGAAHHVLWDAPKFEPQVILPRLATLIRPADHLLLSANLAPGSDYTAGVRRILPLYDNALTRDWLMTFLLDLGVERRRRRAPVRHRGRPRPSSNPGKRLARTSLRGLDESLGEGYLPEFGLKRVAAYFQFLRPREIRVDEEGFAFGPGEEMRLFFSYRHTPALVRALLGQHGLQVEDQWMTKSEEEGVFIRYRPQRLQHRLDARDFVRAEQVGLAQRGQHREERLGAADFLAEILEGMRQGMADRESQGPQAEGVQEDAHLVADADRAVLEVAVVEAQPGIDEDLRPRRCERRISIWREKWSRISSTGSALKSKSPTSRTFLPWT